MPIYKLIRGSLSLARTGGGWDDYKIGDLVPLTEDQASRMKGRVEKVVVGEEAVTLSVTTDTKDDSTDTDEESTDTSSTPSRDWSFIRERKATEVIDIIKSLESSDDLLVVRSEEGKSETPRSGVLKAIQTRLTQLEGEKTE